MAQSLIQLIISRELSAPSCRRILAADGITSPYLTINPSRGIFAGASVDVRSTRASVPEIGEVASAAKNMDEYQFRVCSLAPSLPDSDPSKLELQKYRLAVYAAFAKLVSFLSDRPQELGEWSRHARWLVEEISEAYLQASSNVKLYPIRRSEVFDFFGVPEAEVMQALKAHYGQA